MFSIADVWKLVLEHLKKDLSETTINTWFDEIDVIEIKDNTFVLHCRNTFKKGYIESL
ncbi:MAG: chromosomal replication initiator protein DnaA, partial [Christensenellaceae bacterium]|nr:chromosomal replication initiator protein DnaA [Christensenellaceae bacterium]